MATQAAWGREGSWPRRLLCVLFRHDWEVLPHVSAQDDRGWHQIEQCKRCTAQQLR